MNSVVELSDVRNVLELAPTIPGQRQMHNAFFEKPSYEISMLAYQYIPSEVELIYLWRMSDWILGHHLKYPPQA